jgi:hypothetical protein
MLHVEGPWVLLAPGEGANDSKYIEIHDPYGRTATVYGEADDPEVIGTARVITAAPDIAGLLRDLVAASDRNDGESLLNIINDARALLEVDR